MTKAGKSGDTASNGTANPAPGFVNHPDHTIELEQCPEPMHAVFGGKLVADSEKAIVVREADYPPVIYFPPGDVRMDLLAGTDHSSYCPFKGTASYWTIAADGKESENAAWSYQAPYDEMLALKDYIAFYADRVEIGR